MKIVEAVMNQFPNRGASDSKQEQEGCDDDPHLGKYILKGATPFASRDSAALKVEIGHQKIDLITCILHSHAIRTSLQILAMGSMR